MSFNYYPVIRNTKLRLLLIYGLSFLFTACSVQKQIAKSAQADLLDTKALQAAHVGISIFDPAANKYLYNYQGDKYFVPASNIKLPTCYAAMKYLGDSLVGLRWEEKKDNFFIQATADPTFLHPDFPKQPVFNFLKSIDKKIFYTEHFSEFTGYGNGWSWNDFNEAYMAERSAMPIYNNLIKVQLKTPRFGQLNKKDLEITPAYFSNKVTTRYLGNSDINSIVVKRAVDENIFFAFPQASKVNTEVSVPFKIFGKGLFVDSLLSDTLHKDVVQFSTFLSHLQNSIHSQPTDSLLKPMMHRSDNFFAEQSLLMVSNEMLGVMNDEKIIDTILKTDFRDLPQKPRWADGSGLSRYNLFTPQDFVFILNKMKNEFGMERLKVILPTGGEGTISSYYKADSGYIYGKTGTLSGVVAFSGFLYTKKGKLLIFSTLVNNHQATATEVRRAVEKFLQGVRNRY